MRREEKRREKKRKEEKRKEKKRREEKRREKMKDKTSFTRNEKEWRGKRRSEMK